MRDAELPEVLVDVIEHLHRTGYDERARWFSDRLNLLRDPDVTSEQLDQVGVELHSTVLGMGGLLDLEPKLNASSKLSRLEAKNRMNELADRLYRLTK